MTYDIKNSISWHPIGLDNLAHKTCIRVQKVNTLQQIFQLTHELATVVYKRRHSLY